MYLNNIIYKVNSIYIKFISVNSKYKCKVYNKLVYYSNYKKENFTFFI